MTPQVKQEGSNPTPRASLGDSCRSLNSSNEAIFLCTHELVTKKVQISEDNMDANNIATTCTDLEAKINAVTQDTSKPYFRNVLKPWLLYIFRHSALTQKSQILPEAVLWEHAGWTMSSKMTEIYVHLSGESSRIILQKKGIIKAKVYEK